MNRKTLLVLAASLYQLDTIETAKRLGYRVLTTDNVPTNPGHALADKSFQVDTTDKDGVLDLARSERIDGIIACCTDVAVPTAAYVAEQLRLPGPSLVSANTLCDKPAFREFLCAHGFPSPEHYRLGEGFRPQDGLFDGRRWILKPDRSSGSKGIFVVGSESEFRVRFPETAKFSPSGAGILEEYIEGAQGTCEGVLKDGRMALACITDRQTVDPPYVATRGHRVPTTLPAHARERLLSTLGKLWGELGVTDGPFDCDFVATREEVYIIEMTPRIGGNSLAALLRKAADFDIVEYSVRQACGDDGPLPDRLEIRPTAIVIFGVSKPGRLSYDEREAEALRSEEWVDSISFDGNLGDSVLPFINGRHRVGQALIVGKDRTDLDSKAAELSDRLRMEAV
jgi:biotin carboxylase